VTLMLVRFAHVTHKHGFDVAFRLQLWAAVKRFFDGFGEELPSVQAFVLSEFRKTRADYGNKRLTIQTCITFYVCSVLCVDSRLKTMQVTPFSVKLLHEHVFHE
jgi:hypothetical protein